MEQTVNLSSEADFSQVLAKALEWHRDGEFRKAIPVYLAVLEHAPDNSDALHYLGLAHRSAGDWEAARDSIRKAVESDPGYFEAWNNLGVTYQFLNQLEQAEACFLKAIELKPEHADSHNNLGVILKSQQRWVDAGRAFGEALNHEPDHPRAHHNLGNLYRKAGYKEDAIKHFRAALRPGKASVTTRQALIKLLHLNGQLDEAKEVLDEWLRQDPDNAIARHTYASLKFDETPSRASDEYVKTVFDNMAGHFDKHLQELQYHAPELIQRDMEAVLSEGAGGYKTLDSGCGTGLCGHYLRPLSALLEGVDLSPEMLTKARLTGYYDELHEAELTEFLQQRPGAYDIVVCSDTLCYFGDLGPVSMATAKSLKTGGRYWFTVENFEDEDEAGFRLQHNGRYAHQADYVRTVIGKAGLVIESIATEVLRIESGFDVQGLVVRAVKGEPS